jgi:hypothetical protein
MLKALKVNSKTRKEGCRASVLASTTLERWVARPCIHCEILFVLPEDVTKLS